MRAPLHAWRPPKSICRLLAAGRIDEQHNLIIDPNLIAVGMHAGRRRPEQIREAIRAAGPTIEVET